MAKQEETILQLNHFQILIFPDGLIITHWQLSVGTCVCRGDCVAFGQPVVIVEHHDAGDGGLNKSVLITATLMNARNQT